MTDFGGRVIAVWYAFLALLLFLVGFFLIIVHYTVPLPLTSTSMGLFGVAISGVFGVIPILVGLFFLLIAGGLWAAHEWAAWIAIAVGILGALGSVSSMVFFTALKSIPLAGAAAISPLLFVPPLVIYGGSAAYLFVRRDEFG